ncbi:Zn-dependent hydrolase [Roseococcus suduntuyensis]|uniref:N-carbamoyl-L-amino-acid hydrolase n=1 Tax=Roseococcus suduntuyensis TaxID=455361 RepID=A0A840AKA8_9PROT|nr:Zn-dependent hydrolase [Roseococcus suduntuyensis]MBB3900455.1 N-carbamoyl-L-amino-acid hydrolase [Roseococcus suduntuyensis]
MAEPDTARFLADLHALRQIGQFKTGVHRPTYTPQDMESRRWLMERMREVGLEPEMDGLGNVLGKHPGAGPKLLVGSHIETQNEAGWLDGALGVVAGLALARAGMAVDVVAFADEEAHYGSFLGSRSMVGEVTEAEIDAARHNMDGKPLRQALREAGLEGLPRMRLDPARYKGFLELHIEQGTQLEQAGLRSGVVTGIFGIRYFKITAVGQQDHTGGTTMAERKDANVAAMRVLAMIDEQFPMHVGERTVWTCGRVVLEPNAPHIIAGRAELIFQFRDLSEAVLDRLETLLTRIVQEVDRRDRCALSLERLGRSAPAIADPALHGALCEAATRHANGQWQPMPSGAIHDAQHVAKIMPMAMLFTPSIGGISHHWAEDTKEEDLVLSLRILADAAEKALAS